MMRWFLAVLFFAFSLGLGALKPMEPLSSYNVILVHGAADSASGFVCGTDSIYPEAANVLADNKNPKIKSSWQLGGAAGMIGSYIQREKLTAWLDSAVFEDYVYQDGKPFEDSIAEYSSPYIYIQRSFMNPAESPVHNAREIGDRTWKGKSGCRMSLPVVFPFIKIADNKEIYRVIERRR